MKTFWILFIIVFFSLIGNSKLTAQLPSGWQHLEYCADTCTTPWSPIYNVVVTIPELPNCNIAVGGYMRICNGEVEIVIMGYYIYNTSQACIDDFNALTDQQKNNIQISLFNKMTELIFYARI